MDKTVSNEVGLIIKLLASKDDQIQLENSTTGIKDIIDSSESDYKVSM